MCKGGLVSYFALLLLHNEFNLTLNQCAIYFVAYPFEVLKVASAILGRYINDHVHLIFPHGPLAACPISRPSKNHVSVGSLGSEILHKNKWYYRPLKTKINSVPTNHRQEVGVVVFCAAFMIVFTGCTKQRREGRAGSVCLGSRFKYQQR